MIGTNHHLKVI